MTPHNALWPLRRCSLQPGFLPSLTMASADVSHSHSTPVPVHSGLVSGQPPWHRHNHPAVPADFRPLFTTTIKAKATFTPGTKIWSPENNGNRFCFEFFQKMFLPFVWKCSKTYEHNFSSFCSLSLSLFNNDSFSTSSLQRYITFIKTAVAPSESQVEAHVA